MPIIFGVVLASLKLSFDPITVSLGEFNVYGFAGAMISNVAFALRSILVKNMTANIADCKKKNLSSANVYATYTTFAFVLAIPIACVLEGPVIAEKWSEIVSTFSSNLPTFSAVVAGGSELRLSEMHLITGLFFYLYNEASSLALGNLDGVAHAVCNTVKRVVIMVAMSLFDQPLTAQKWTGAGIAIGGTLLYTLAKKASEIKKKRA